MSFSALIAGFKVWKEINIESSEGILKRNAAIGCVIEAVLATKAYLYDKEMDGTHRATERLLSQKWQTAALAIEMYDRQLFISSEVKALGWSDPTQWIRAEGREFSIKLDIILEQCAFLRNEFPQRFP